MSLIKLISTSAIISVFLLGTVSDVQAANRNGTKYCEDEACKVEMNNLIKLAKNGSGRAAALVAMAYATGDGLEEDAEKAERFLKRGVRYRDPVATFMMYGWLREGFVVEKNIEKSDEMLDRAIKLEYAPAMYRKALAIFKSEDDEKISEAVELLENASEQKNMDAMFLLARLKQTGTATPKDLEGAADLLTTLTRARHPSAKTHLVEVVNESAGTEQHAELVANLRAVEDIEVIEVRGQRMQVGLMLDGLVNRLRESGQYDANSIGSRIRGVSCAQAAYCVSVSTDAAPGASSAAELLSGGR